MAARAGTAVGLGYRRSEVPAAALIASMTLGDGGSGDSLVLSLTQSSPSTGCSPGTYGSKPRRAFFRKLSGIYEASWAMIAESLALTPDWPRGGSIQRPGAG
jgi:hypothetical protein